MERSENLTAATAPARDLSGSYIDVPAVLAGALVATALGGLFTTFGAAIGFSTLSAKTGSGSFDLWMIVTAVWLVLSMVLSFLAGGYIAGRMRRRVDAAASDEVAAHDGINGLVVWALALLLTAWIAAGVVRDTTAVVGSAAGVVGSVVGGAVGGVAEGAGAAAGGLAQVASQAVTGQAGSDAAGGGAEGQSADAGLSALTDGLLRPALQGAQQADGASTPTTPAADPAELARQSGIILGNVLKTGEISEEDRQFLVAATAARTGLSPEEVNTRVDGAIKAVEDSRAAAEKALQDAKQMAIDAAETARISAILTAFLITAAALVAAAAALIGGVRGGRHRDEGRLFGGFTYKL